MYIMILFVFLCNFSFSMSEALILLLILKLDLLGGDLLTKLALWYMKIGGMIVFINLLGNMSLR